MKISGNEIIEQMAGINQRIAHSPAGAAGARAQLRAYARKHICQRQLAAAAWRRQNEGENSRRRRQRKKKK